MVGGWAPDPVWTLLIKNIACPYQVLNIFKCVDAIFHFYLDSNSYYIVARERLSFITNLKYGVSLLDGPYLLTPWSRVLPEKLTVNFAVSQEIPRIYGSSLPYPKVPATCPYPEPTPSSPFDSLQLPEDPS
jgi:hypothetical protein